MTYAIRLPDGTLVSDPDWHTVDDVMRSAHGRGETRMPGELVVLPDEDDVPLFDGYEPAVPPASDLSPGQRLTQRQAGLVAMGIHPLTRRHLHPDADPTRTSASPQDGTPTCGTCVHRELLDYHNKRYPKCLLNADKVTHGPASDVRAWWPGCLDFTPIKEGT